MPIGRSCQVTLLYWSILVANVYAAASTVQEVYSTVVHVLLYRISDFLRRPQLSSGIQARFIVPVSLPNVQNDVFG